MGRLTVWCLGSLEVAIDGRPVTLTTGRLRTLLVVLALSAGRTVSFERLVETVCGEDPVMDVRATLQTYKSRLRRRLGPEWVEVTPSGYALNVEPDDVDVLRFDRLLDLAERTSDPERERELLAEATGLWRGTPFGDVRSEWLAQAEAPRLTERYLRAVERLADLGGGDLATLERLASEHPLRESLWSRLIAALGRYGRTAEALERYETIRVRITTELGVDPGGGLREIHSGLGGRRVVPRQLPPDLPGFVGREPALARLDESSGVVTISGTAGVGKPNSGM